MPSTPTREDRSAWRTPRAGTPARAPRLSAVRTSADTLTFELDDGRTITAPIDWYPRLVYATAEERSEVEIIGGDTAYWPMLDEGIRVDHVLAGGPSPEGARSLETWRQEMDRRRQEGRLHDPWGAELPLPDWWEDEGGNTKSIVE